MIGFGLGVLRLAPDALWATTPRELAAAMRARRGGDAGRLGRVGLEAMMRRWPDH